MGALAALGVGLSVLFGAFLMVLAVELYYMVCWRRSRTGGGSTNRVNDLQEMELEAAGAAGMGSYAREAALVGSFGGYPASQVQSHFVAKFFHPGDDAQVAAAMEAIPAAEYIPDQFPPPFSAPLFTITEETTEEMDLHKLHQHLPKTNSATSATTSRSSASASVSASASAASSCITSFAGREPHFADSDTTPFFTPPSSAANSVSSSPTSVASPSTAVSRFSPVPIHPLCTTSPASNSSSPPHPRRSSSASTSSLFPGQRSSLGSLFRQSSPQCLISPSSPPAFAALRSTRSSLVVDFRNALPFSPQNPPVHMVHSSPFVVPADLDFLARVGRNLRT